MEDDFDPFADEDDQPTAAEDALFSVVPTLLSGLRISAAEEEQVESLLQLAQLVDTSFGGRAVRLCSLVAKEGGIGHLAALVGHEREWLHQTSMLVLGNLASDSQEVEDALKASGHFENLLPHLFSDNPATVTFALGAVRNVCGDPDYVSAMQRQGAMRRLQVHTPARTRGSAPGHTHTREVYAYSCQLWRGEEARHVNGLRSQAGRTYVHACICAAQSPHTASLALCLPFPSRPIVSLPFPHSHIVYPGTPRSLRRSSPAPKTV